MKHELHSALVFGVVVASGCGPGDSDDTSATAHDSGDSATAQPTILSDIALFAGFCDGGLPFHEVWVSRDQPALVEIALVMTGAPAPPQDEVHPLTWSENDVWEVTLEPVPVGTAITPGVTSQFTCEDTLAATRVAMLRDQGGQLVDCVAIANDAAGLLNGEYSDSTQSGAWNALGVNASNCRVQATTGG